MAQLGKRVSAYVRQEQAKGRDFVSIMQDKALLELNGFDQDEANKAFVKASKNDHLSNFRRSRAEQGLPPYFTNQQEMLAAIGDEAYAKSPDYRAAIQEIIGQSNASDLGISGHMTTAHGEKVSVGRDQLSQAATEESMLNNMRIEALRETWQKMNMDTSANGRYQRALWLRDNKDAVAEMERDLVSPEQRMRHQLLDIQESSGGALKIQTGQDGAPVNPKDIDFSTGKYADGSEPPTGAAFVKGERIS